MAEETFPYEITNFSGSVFYFPKYPMQPREEEIKNTAGEGPDYP